MCCFTVEQFPNVLSISFSFSRQEQRLPSIQTGRVQPQDTTIGFQVDRVKHAEHGEGKVRITVYYASTGKVHNSCHHSVLTILLHIACNIGDPNLNTQSS